MIMELAPEALVARLLKRGPELTYKTQKLVHVLPVFRLELRH